MNNLNKMKKILLTFFSIAVLTACSNDDDSPVNSTIDHPISFIELTGNNNQLDYTLVSVKAENAIDFDNDGNASTDVYAQIPKCELDDLFIFTYVKSMNNYVWSMTENTVVCDDNLPYYTKNSGSFNPDPNLRTIEFFDDEQELVFKATNVKLIERNTPEKVSFELTFDFYDPYFKTTLHYKYIKEY